MWKVLKTKGFRVILPYEQLKTLWKLLKKGLFMQFLLSYDNVETIKCLKYMNKYDRIIEQTADKKG